MCVVVRASCLASVTAVPICYDDPMHTFANSIRPVRPLLICTKNYEFKSIAMLPTNKTIIHTSNSHTHMHTNKSMREQHCNCELFWRNSHIILNTPPYCLHAKYISKCRTLLVFRKLLRISFWIPLCFILFALYANVAHSDEIIILLFRHTTFRKSIFSHTVCVIFIDNVATGGGSGGVDAGVVLVQNRNDFTRKSFANSQ